MKYPLIKKLGLDVHQASAFKYSTDTNVLVAQCLETLLSKAQRVRGYKHRSEWEWYYGTSLNDEDLKLDTHTALLIAIEPIKRGVSKKEITSALRQMENDGHINYGFKEIADRIESEGIID